MEKFLGEQTGVQVAGTDCHNSMSKSRTKAVMSLPLPPRHRSQSNHFTITFSVSDNDPPAQPSLPSSIVASPTILILGRNLDLDPDLYVLKGKYKFYPLVFVLNFVLLV